MSSLQFVLAACFLSIHSGRISGATNTVQTDPLELNQAGTGESSLRDGIAAIRRGEWDAAARKLSDTIRFNPLEPTGYAYRGSAYFAMGNFKKAISDFSTVIQLQPTNAQAFCNRGSAYRAEKNFDRAIEDLNFCIQLNPTNASAYKIRAACYSSLGDSEKEIKDWTAVLALTPSDVKVYCMRGSAFLLLGQKDKAKADFDTAIKLGPRDPSGHNALAWLLATSPDDKYRSGKEAVAHATKACDLTHWERPDYLDTLAAAYAELGNFERAVEYERRALSMKPSSLGGVGGDDTRELQRRLEFYEQRQPFREGEKISRVPTTH